MWTFSANGQDDPAGTPESSAALGEFLASVVDAHFHVEDLAPLAGQPVALQFNITAPDGVTIVELPQFPLEWGPLELTEISEPVMNHRDDGSVSLTQRMSARVWIPGTIEFPETFVGYQIDSSNEIFRIPAIAPTLTVPSVLATDSPALRPMRSTIGFFLIPLWAPFALTIFVAGLAYMYMRRRDSQSMTKISPAPMTMEERQNRLLALRQSKLSAERMYSGASNSLRNFLDTVCQVPAFQMTTSEIVDAASKSTDLSEPAIVELGTILGSIDVAKYSGAATDRANARRVIDRTSQWFSVAVSDYLANVTEVATSGDGQL